MGTVNSGTHTHFSEHVDDNFISHMWLIQMCKWRNWINFGYNLSVSVKISVKVVRQL